MSAVKTRCGTTENETERANEHNESAIARRKKLKKNINQYINININTVQKEEK